MTVAVKLPPRMTVADFLALPGDGTGRICELVDGVVRMQDAASDTHGSIQSNVIRLVGNHLAATRPGCRVVTTPGVQPRVRSNWNYRVPDLGVTCTPNRADVHITPAPILLVEVLSPSNEDKTWSNMPLYASLPSVLEILIVDSSRMAAEVLRRGPDGNWPPDPEPVSAGGILHLASIGLELPLSEVYRGTHLA